MTAFDYRIDSRADIGAALERLGRKDPVLSRLLEQTGIPAPRRRAPGFAGLARIVVGQQVSTQSAAAIWSRLESAFDPLTPRAVAGSSDDVLRAVGLSRPKIRTLRAISEAIASGSLVLEDLDRLTADDAHRVLCAVHGIGPWTADIYLMFCLGHADAWPAGDLALQHAVGAALGMPDRPDARVMAEIGERWRPARGAAALLFWAYYRTLKDRSGVPM